METIFQKTARQLAAFYYGFWAIALLLFLAGELDWIPGGLLAGSERLGFVLQTVVILFTAAGIPGALKLFSWLLVHRTDRQNLTAALATYRFASVLRISLLALVTYGSLLVYYLTFDSTGLLCALIGLTASLFCVPGEQKLRSELRIDA